MTTKTMYPSSTKEHASVLISQELSQLLADTYVTYVKTQNFHWNLIDARFHDLHIFFEGLYQELAEGVDAIAERIRMLRCHPPGTMQKFLELSSLSEGNGQITGNEMIQELLNDRELIIKNIRPMIQKASELNDEGTADLLIQHLRIHEKAAWMLQSHL